MVYRRQRQGKPRSSRLLYRSVNIVYTSTDVLPRVMHCTKRGLHRAADCKDEWPARKPKPYKTLESGLLNTRESDAPAAQRATSVTQAHNGRSSVGQPSWKNATQCHHLPLLRLPSEIRTRIFKFVFTQQKWPCVRSVSHHHKTNAVPGQPESIHFGGYLYLTQHFNPWDNMSLHLQVLRVCKQIYIEAALLPYALNNFFCESPLALEEFESKLKPVQRQAIQEPIRIGHGGKSRPQINLDLSGWIETAPRRQD